MSVNESIDANEQLKEIEAFAAHYDERVASGEGHQAVSVAEMSVILKTVATLFKGVGIGVRKNQVGQAMPARRGWERHG